MADRQEVIDRYYFQHGPCCAGCDWWRSLTSVSGECLQSKIIPGDERMSMMGIRNVSCHVPAGHAVTARDYHCGKFKDEFDWSSLPLAYRKRVGDPTVVTKI